MSHAKDFDRPQHSILGIGYELILKSPETGGAYELMRFVVPPQGGPPPHIHKHEDECFHVTSGTLNVLLGEEWNELSAGQSMHMPRGVPHAFKNATGEFAEFVCWVTPGNLEPFFAAFLRDWPAGDELPPPPDDEAIAALMQAAATREIEMLMGEG